MAITIDPAAKRIILDSTSVTAKAIFRAWADWMLLSDNSKYLPAFSATGGDDLGGGLSIPPYYFLENGWRVRPMESGHTLIIEGNLFVQGGGVPVVSTLGTFQVNVQYTVPVQAQGIATGGSSGPTAAEIAAEVRAELAVELARLDAAITSRIAAGTVQADVRYVNGTQIAGAGTAGNPWGPA